MLGDFQGNVFEVVGMCVLHNDGFLVGRHTDDFGDIRWKTTRHNNSFLEIVPLLGEVFPQNDFGFDHRMRDKH